MFDPGSDLPETLNLRDAIEAGVLEGPHIYTSGPTIDGADGRARPLTIANITRPEDARALVDELARSGVDAIKIYAFLKPAAVAAVIEAAHAHGLPVIGDLVSTPWSVALDSGIDGFIHMMDHKWRFVSAEAPDPADGPWAVVEPDSTVMNAFFARVAEQGAMFDPTLMASSQYFEADTFAAALQRAERSDGGADDAPTDRARILAGMLRIMHRHGVRWVAGTDAGASRLLDELEIYEAIGIPNATILQTATANVARWLRKDDFGTIEPGKRADLILVDGDPLARIHDLENVVLVVQSGRVMLER
jgi:imidazolonepropionase-like amidohydrolase